MPHRLALTLLMLLLVGCRDDALEQSPTPTAVAPPTAVVLPTLLPTVTAAASPTAVARPTIPPTPTSLAEGLTVRLATPDPSPDCPEHYPWFFDNPAAECAATVLNTWAVFQPFERGLMLWTQEGGRTFILLEDGSPFKPYVELADSDASALPGPDPGLQPPAGLYQPVLGFARFWRGLAPNSGWMRDSLGWATRPEMAYSAFWQCNTAAGEAARCYFTGPSDEIIVMTREGARYWAYWQGPVRPPATEVMP
ncbi:MAG: hypothetical protein ACRDHL_08225 [Candidatus Promineifilaceae bacterium]